VDLRLFIVLLLSSLRMGYAQVNDFHLHSPDGALVISIRPEEKGSNTALGYTVSWRDRVVVMPSILGIQSGNADWTTNVQVRQVGEHKRDTVWQTVYGERRDVRDHYNELTLSVTKKDNPKKVLHVIARAYDAGVAFRYFFPEHPDGGDYLRITGETTTYVMPEGTQGYFTPTAQSTYRLLPLKDFPGESERPLTLVLPGNRFVCLAEAALVNYSRTKFQADGDTLRGVMYGQVDEITPFATPWRVIMVADKPTSLLQNNDMILNLNPPNEIDDPSWIKPGKVMREVRLSTSAAKELVDFAVSRNFQFIEFDAGWYGYEHHAGSDASSVSVDPRRNPVNDLDLQEVIQYARARNIGVWLYVNQRALAQQLDEILPLYRKWGVSGVKYGFVHVGSHRWTTWLHDAVKKAAQNQLMVDIHDEYRPTGFSRTYPNLLTQEGILGNEGFPDATHNVTLPFTRYIAGAGDYTICYYRQNFSRPQGNVNPNRTGGTKVLKTTSAHQLALSVICYSPLQFMFWYDVPSDYQNEPEVEFFERVSTVWDETEVLSGEIGNYISIARRKGYEWFVSTATNTEARKVNVPLNFLNRDVRYEATFYDDDPSVKTRTKVRLTRKQVRSSQTLDVELLPSGGQAIWIRPFSDKH
jgi:alpha-glucosidase